MTITLHYGNALASRVGARNGVSEREIKALAGKGKAIHKDLADRRKKGELGFYDLPHDRAAALACKKAARHVRGQFDNFVVLGIGGSALGPICVHTALAHPYHNLLNKKQRKGAPRMFVLDNADPEWVGKLGEAIDLKRTFFSVVSKSGSTPETLAQLMVFHSQLAKAVGKSSADKHICATTDPAKGPMRELAVEKGWMILEVPPNVGGRFSVLSSVGLFPAAVEGINIDKLLKGAADMAGRCKGSNIFKNPAYLYSAIHYLADVKKRKTMSVMMPYSNALRDLADWNRQLWAESLGKALDVNKKKVNAGQTPIKALGATDQHSQVQLYAEGPNDKIFTFVGAREFRNSCRIPRSLPSLGDLSYLCGAEMGKLLNEELNATEFALTKNGRPCLRIELDKISPENIGGMFYMLELATAFSGGLYNIDAFDQPGVEEGKQATAALMGRGKPQDEKKRLEIAKANEKAGKVKI